jgi:integrase
MLSSMTSISEKMGVFTMRNDFTLFYRVVPSGKKVVYYYAYDDEGTRKGPWSTGQASKTLARNFCNALNRKGALLPQGKSMPTFEEYAAGFWDWDNSPYLKERRKRVRLTQNYTDKCKNVSENTLVSHFGKMKLDKITGEVIEGWLDAMIETGKKNVTINGYFGTLMTMLKWAVRKRIIERDPFLDVQRLIKEPKEKKIITQDEFKAMFVDDWKKVWDNDLLMCTAHKLAALTSMRCSEVLGLKGEYIFDNYLYLCGQFDDYGYRETKTKIKHQIPLPAELARDLQRLMRINRDGFVFSEDGGETPITRRRVYLGLQRACKSIGIDEDEMKKRGINVHAWRHFCNTELLKGGLSVKKVQAVTGHKSENMTDNYTHFDPMEFAEVSKIQEMLLKPKKNKSEKEQPALTLVKQPEKEKDKKRRQAS